MSEVEILSSFARDFCSIAQHFVCSSESSIQRSEHSVFDTGWEYGPSGGTHPNGVGSELTVFLLLFLLELFSFTVDGDPL